LAAGAAAACACAPAAWAFAPAANPAAPKLSEVELLNDAPTPLAPARIALEFNPLPLLESTNEEPNVWALIFAPPLLLLLLPPDVEADALLLLLLPKLLYPVDE
jgi:hypothetical protein